MGTMDKNGAMAKKTLNPVCQPPLEHTGILVFRSPIPLPTPFLSQVGYGIGNGIGNGVGNGGAWLGNGEMLME